MPYLLIAPALIYLAMFFAYPMYEGLILAFFDDEAALPLLDEPSVEGSETARVPQGTALDVLDRRSQVMVEEGGGDALTELWFRISGEAVDGSDVEGWVPETRIRVREEDPNGVPLAGSVRPVLGQDADPLTPVYTEASDASEVVGQLEQRAPVTIEEVAELELWFLVAAADTDEVAEGWAPSRYLQIFEDGERGRVQRGTAGEFTTQFVQDMIDDRFFAPALRTTLLLMAIIVPAQFVLAMIMALVIHSRIRFSSGFLYAFTLPIGMSDLAVGILFFSIFTGNGLLNSVLEGVGLIDSPKAFLTAETTGWIIFAIFLAELWRATSIVMVILVSGLQAIPDETLEAAELFGASYWQRVRHIILPLLRPSIQVALILRTILALQVFAVVVALTGGHLRVLALEAFNWYADLRNEHVASVYATIILVASMVVTAIYLRVLRVRGDQALS